MKAVMLAGGLGNRLRPITCTMPKPMVPVAGRPVMEYGIRLLKRAGIEDIAATLHYMPKSIIEHFGSGEDLGVRMRWYTEETPLGTAGSITLAKDFLNETFIVMSADALADIDLEYAVDFHKSSRALATIVLYKSDHPTEYGVVSTDDDGRITKFTEKPSWGQVVSDTVNTGIYILEPEIFDYIGSGQQDFAKDVFPALLEKGSRLMGCTVGGYWLDIGEFMPYLKANFDVLDGLVPITGITPSGITVAEGAAVEQGAYLYGPCFISSGAVINAGATVGPYAFIGSNAEVKSGASVKRSVVFRGSSIGHGTSMRGAIAAEGARIGDDNLLWEGSAAGALSKTGEGAALLSGAKLWPGKYVSPGGIVSADRIWDNENDLSLQSGRITLEEADCPSAEEIMRSARAFSRHLGKRILLSMPSEGRFIPAAFAACAGAAISGSDIYTAEDMPRPVFINMLKTKDYSGGIFFAETERGHEIRFYGPDGRTPDADVLKKIQQSFQRGEYRFIRGTEPGSIIGTHADTESYLRLYDGIRLPQGTAPHISSVSETIAGLAEMCITRCGGSVSESGADLTAELSPVGNITRLCGGGAVIGAEYLPLLRTCVLAENGAKKLYFPPGCVYSIEELAGRYGASVATDEPAPEGLRLFYEDDIYFLMRLTEFMNIRRCCLRDITAKLPQISAVNCDIPCSWEDRGYMMGELLKREHADSPEGVMFKSDKGQALVLPDESRASVGIYAEAATEEYAAEIAGDIADMLLEILKRSPGNTK